MKKTLLIILVLFVSFASQLFATEAIKVIYDDTHGQTAGNADWLIEGAYSEMADLLKDNGFSIDSLKSVSPDKHFSTQLLSNYQAVILAEPNNPYAPQEQEALVEFVKNGGGAFIIGDHGGADRDNDGWDAVKVFNVFCNHFGFQFTGNFLYEAPVSGPRNSDHPAMFRVHAVGAWAGSTFSLVPTKDAKPVNLLESRLKKAPYILASEVGKGRVVAIGDSSPFDDGVGSGAMKKLHDSYNSFLFSHPQFAYNTLKWISGQTPDKVILSRQVPLANEAKIEEKSINLFVDAAHGNAASDKMETFERHMNKLGVKLYYGTKIITNEILKKFKVVILPDPSLSLLEAEKQALADWFLAGGKIFIACNWDSAQLNGRRTLNSLLEKMGSIVRFNDDQVLDHTNKTNKPWGVIAHVFLQDHPISEGVKNLITWGTCSLVTRDLKPLTKESGVEILVSGDNDTFNKDGNKKNDAIIYPKGTPIPLFALEKLARGEAIFSGCCNFTDYQYPDSDINQAKPGQPPFTHETPLFMDNLVKYLFESSQK